MAMAEALTCLFCGEAIERTAVDPCSAVIAPSLPTQPRSPGDDAPARVIGATWQQRPPGQFWLHAACLRRVAHPSVPLHFLDMAEEDER